MSHVSSVELEVKDLDALERAVQSCGLELVRGQTSIRWYGRHVNDYHGADAAHKHGISPSEYGKCAHAIRIPNNKEAYEIGVRDKGDGTYQLYYDFWGPGGAIVKLVGKGCEKLKQHYAKAVAIQTLQKKGFTIKNEEDLASGSLKVTLQGQLKLG
jgi:hypothetical protein